MARTLRLRRDLDLEGASIIIGLDGWVNAGSASTLSLNYLIRKLEAEKLGEIPPGSFYGYSMRRPIVNVEGGLIKEYETPRNSIYAWKGDARCLVLLLGVEPDLNWPGYSEAIMELSVATKARRIYTLGGYISMIPHTIEPPVTGSTNTSKLLGELKAAGIELTNYRGPTGVYSQILWDGAQRGLEVVSLWTAVPQYVSVPNSKAALALLRKLTLMENIQVALSDLENDAYILDRKIAEEAKMNPELLRLIEELERGYKIFRASPSYRV
ncbi:MAG: PAC2 family protein [Candidatus Bathyarchaeia archaeon]